VSASYYTSYETSVALREAGAPRNPDGDRERAWYVSATRGGEPRLINATGAPDETRAFRLDEIMEALEKLGHVTANGPNREVPDPYWGVYFVPYDYVGEHAEEEAGEDVSPVEAAAACLLAVLRAAREVAR